MKMQTPAEKVASLGADFTEKDGFEAIKILEEAGFTVSVAPVSGLLDPELIIGSDPTVYTGLEEIREAVVQEAAEKEKG